jgi:hypothetical protein
MFVGYMGLTIVNYKIETVWKVGKMSTKKMRGNNLLKIGSIFGIFILIIGLSFVPLTGGMIEELKVNKLNKSEVNGLYYLRGDDPLNWSDIGSLLKNLPVENELTQCGMFVNFHFAEPGVYVGTNTIFNIYYRFWQKVDANGQYEVGYSTSSEHTAGCNESFWVDTTDNICEVNDYRLVQVSQIINPEIAVFEEEEIYNFTIKFFGPNPNILCNPNQYSFVFLNLEDNTTLQSYDRDGDGINDYDELFVYFTNPFDSDTDNDGFSDYEEINSGTNGNDYGEFPALNNPPNKPIGSGPTSGKIGISYDYNFVLTDADGDNMFLWIDWGDDSAEEWIGPYDSGEEVKVSHTWDKKGTFTIRYKAKDIYEVESEWGTLSLTISRNKAANNMLFFHLLERFTMLHKLLFLIR